MALPHIENSEVGINKMEPLYKSLYEVTFTLPKPLDEKFGTDIALITEQVKTISGLTVASKGVETATQKFMGTTRTFLNSKIDDTSFEIEIHLNLNLRNGTDNFVYKLFKAWKDLGYNLETGETALKTDYCADWLKCQVGNRRGDVYREIIMKDVFLFGGLEGMDDYDYESNELQELAIKFKSDRAKETVA